MSQTKLSANQIKKLTTEVKQLGSKFGFQKIGITNIDLNTHQAYLERWIRQGFAGSMSYMSKHGDKRSRPDLLVPGTIRVISARMNYLPTNDEALNTLNSPEKAYIARYALGRDYHKVIRKRLNKLALSISKLVPYHQYRVFTDSAPVLEKALAEKSGLGWIGKNTLLIHKEAGSWFFLGEIYTNLPLLEDRPSINHCGSCNTCIDICPTKAIVAPYTLDARKCIAYLTIENRDGIPISLREAIGNRIFGCDDCQLFCPWTKFSDQTKEKDFSPRHQLNASDLLTLFEWSESQFLENTMGSPIRRAGYRGWLRNLAIALGNSPYNSKVVKALEKKKQAFLDTDDMLVEHITWAIEKQLK